MTVINKSLINSPAAPLIPGGPHRLVTCAGRSSSEPNEHVSHQEKLSVVEFCQQRLFELSHHIYHQILLQWICHQAGVMLFPTNAAP